MFGWNIMFANADKEVLLLCMVIGAGPPLNHN
jgi:hypothetical protein